MDIHARRRQAGIGIAYLMEVVASTLQEAYDNDEGGLMATVVAERTGIPQRLVIVEVSAGTSWTDCVLTA